MKWYNIEQLPSGFYAITRANSGDIIRADLIPWDGKKGTPYHYNIISDETKYYIDADNNVYYDNGYSTALWCSGKDLNAHCHHLQQILARR